MQSQAQPRPAPGSEDIKPLFASSDTVCVGKVLSVSSGVATVLVERYYKSTDTGSSIKVRYSKPEASAGTNSVTLAPGEHVLLFLRRANQEFEFADPWFSKLPMSSYLAKEGRRPGLAQLELDLEAGLNDPQRQSIRNNLEILGGMEKLERTTKIRELAASPELEIRAAALLALQRVGDYSHIQQSLELMSLPIGGGTLSEALRLLPITFESVNDRRVLPILFRFADSPYWAVRTSVMKALRNLHDPRSVPMIVRRLEDSDFFIRYDAVFTLAAIEEKQDANWLPALGEYKKYESRYLNQWKQWWATEGSAKYNSP
jgi:hypothetical protein